MVDNYAPYWIGTPKENRRTYDRFHRDPVARKFYASKDWAGPNGIRRLQLALFPLCQDCGHVATEVHHVVPISQDPQKALVLENLRSLCHSCHLKQRRKKP